MLIARRLVGMMIIIFSLASLVLDGVGLQEVWRLRWSLDAQITSGLDAAADTMLSAEKALSLIDKQLATTTDSLDAAERASASTVTTLSAAGDSVKRTAQVLRTDIPRTVDATRQAMVSAQASAALVDNVLESIASLPFGLDYRPEQPLGASIGQMAATLDPLPVLTRNIATDLDQTADGLSGATPAMRDLSAAIANSRSGIVEARATTRDFTSRAADARLAFGQMKISISSALGWAAVGATFLVVWLALMQIGAIIFGVRLMRS